MNYYPTNFYSNYPYMQQYPNGPMLSSQQQIMQQNNGLQGKIVDGEDIVRVTDVPMGGYGIFPKADFSEVYIKSWNSNGTTNIVTYKPVVATPETPKEDTTNILLEKMNTLEEKIDSIILPKTDAAAATHATTKRKEF